MNDEGPALNEEEVKNIHRFLSEHFKCFALVAADMNECEVRMTNYGTDLQGVALQQLLEDMLQAYIEGETIIYDDSTDYEESDTSEESEGDWENP
jgi:hypothetical protein